MPEESFVAIFRNGVSPELMEKLVSNPLTKYPSMTDDNVKDVTGPSLLRRKAEGE